MSEPVSVVTAIAAAVAVAAAIAIEDGRRRAAALLIALALAAAVIAGEAWDGALREIRDSDAKLALVLLGGAAVLGAGAALFDRWPRLLPLALIAALPFRVPVEAGGETSNLLVPLYAVIAGGAFAFALSLRRPRRVGAAAAARPLRLAIAAVIVLYAVQASYSGDISRAVQNVAFFLVPFGVMLVLMLETRWTPRLLVLALAVGLAEGVLFALVGIGQQVTKEIFWNPRVLQSNEFDLYFRVNSLFWDPNIYGRYLALTTLIAVSALLWTRDRAAAWLAAAVALLWVGLALSFSQTSFAALLAGLAVLAALRWSLRWTLALLAVIAIGLSGFLLATGSLYDTTSGRSDLAGEGLDIALDRPLGGHGSGSFSVAFSERNDIVEGEATISHTEPVTVAAEQGLVGMLAYGALLVVAATTLFGGLVRRAPGLGGDADPARRAVEPAFVARIAVAAAFTGMFVDSIGYAAFLTDPLTWALLALGAALAPARARSPSARPASP